ncbi:hypothetical protein Dimus_020987 [Dionaea muscipula]
MDKAAEAPTSSDMADNEETSPQPQPTSLFPISHAPTSATASASSPASVSATTPPTVSGWLRNTSFTVDLAVVNEATSSLYGVNHLDVAEIDGEGEEPSLKVKSSKPSNSSEFVAEPSGTDDEGRDDSEYADRGRDTSKSGKKKKSKKRKISGEYGKKLSDFGSRKSSVRAWSSSEAKPCKDYYFDSRPDPDNLAFGSLYRFDVARYKLLDSGKKLERNCQAYCQASRRSLMSGQEMDNDVLDNSVKSSGRYWSGSYSAIERHKNLKRIRIIMPQKSKRVFLDDFIPLSNQDTDGGSLLEAMFNEESWEDEVLRKTKEFNKMTREHPHNVRAWLDFAEFQDRVASMQQQKGARLQTLEKKISILEKAVDLNPDDEDLLLRLLKAYQGRGSTDNIIAIWEKILMQHSESCKLWKEFLNIVLREFSMFKVSEQRRMYGHAINALSAACSKKRQAHRASVPPHQDSAVVELELGLVDLFLSLCHFEWQAGYRELATALFQAEIEYSLFCPSLQLTEHSKQRLFEHFWNSDGARVGEDSAVGWSTWLEREEGNRQRVISEMAVQENEVGGWTGWFTPTKQEEISAGNENVADADASLDLEEATDDPDKGDVMQVDDDDALLKMMGINIDAEASSDIKDTATWARWSEEESLRDDNQWLPLHAKSGVSHGGEAMDQDEEEKLSRVVLFEDVSEYLFSLSSAQAQLSLVTQFVDFFGGQNCHRISTNSSSWRQKILSLEGVPDYILQDLRRVHDALIKGNHSRGFSLEFLLPCVNDYFTRTDIMVFLRNAILLCLTVFPRNYNLEEAALIADEQSIMGSGTTSFAATPCQALAKRLLKSDRQDLLLCGVYARREAAFGNYEHARKVFDMALSSISVLPQESRSNAPILYFWYAEMELASSSHGRSASSSRILHILHFLGCQIAYSPYKYQPSSVQLLRAHQGFKEQLKTARASWASGDYDDSSIALVCSAALFEEFSAGCTAAVNVLLESLAMVLPETKRGSYQLEFLLNYYLAVSQRHYDQTSLSKLLPCVSHGLQIYPENPQLFRSLVEVCSTYIVPNKLRQLLDSHFQKNPSVIALLFALSFELSRGGLQPRIHGLFERALALEQLHTSVLLWRCYIAYEINVAGNFSAAKRIYFRAIHACPWSKKLWLDGFLKLNGILTAKELSDLQEVMQDKELNLRTDIYEILLQQDLSHC